MSRVLIIIPTYNEATNLPLLVNDLRSLPIEGLEILIVDDNSSDGTGQIAERLGLETGAKVHVIHRAGKQGLGTAYIQGFRWAIERNFDVIVQMDADFSHDPKFVPQLVEAAKDWDAV